MPTPNTIDFFDTYTMVAIAEQIVPEVGFFMDRYSETSASDIFSTDKVLTEFKDGNEYVAPFVAPAASDIPVGRQGYEVHEFTPAKIAPSRLLTLDDLKKRGFGEAMYATSTPAQRAMRLLQGDMQFMESAIHRREEMMVAELLQNNKIEIQEYIDNEHTGAKYDMSFFRAGKETEHLFSVEYAWNSSDAAKDAFFVDVKHMARALADRGQAAVDLVVGSDVADWMMSSDAVKAALDKNSGIHIGSIEAELSKYVGVAFLGQLNFSGYKLNVIEADERIGGTSLFAPTSAMVTAPKCTKMLYGAVTQIPHNSDDYVTIAAKRVPKLFVDRDKDIRKLRLQSRPLAAPKAFAPMMVAKNVVG